MSGRVTCRRVYDDPAPTDGARILVDRVWPRGLRKQDARLEEWMREIAPSTALRQWYGHEPARFDEFRRRYAQEMTQPPRAAAFGRLREIGQRRAVTLLTASRDLDRSQAAILAGWLRAGVDPAAGDPAR